MQEKAKSAGPDRISLQIPARYSYLRIVRQAVGDLCAQTCVSEFKAAQLEMAVDEICAELIGKLRPQAESGTPSLHIVLRREAGEIVGEIFYGGQKIEFPALTEVKQASPEDTDRLGSYVVHRFVDRIEHVNDPESGWTVRLHKAI